VEKDSIDSYERPSTIRDMTIGRSSPKNGDLHSGLGGSQKMEVRPFILGSQIPSYVNMHIKETVADDYSALGQVAVRPRNHSHADESAAPNDRQITQDRLIY
jgi:hypothetical protein